MNTQGTNLEANYLSRLLLTRLHRWFLMGLAVSAFANVAVADTIIFGGNITQSQDQTNPATNNPTLNNIKVPDAYTVTLGFLGSITFLLRRQKLTI